MNKLKLVIFGVTSNLSKIKLIPALYGLWLRGEFPGDLQIIGLSFRERSEEEIRSFLKDSLEGKKINFDKNTFEKFYKLFVFRSGDLGNGEIYKDVRKLLMGKDSANIMFYLATHPSLYASVFEKLKINKLNKSDNGWVKIMIEKPIGSDYKSSKELNDLMAKYFTESQIFRIDHYLAKETIQNILTFRFHNKIFEPVWNSKYIDHIQITAAESFGAELRNAYYDSVGALRDVAQNHVLQMLALVLMKKPKQFNNKQITAERMAILSKLVPMPRSLILGQYENYSQSKILTDTFFAFKTEVDTKKFSKIPIYIRGGKKLKKTVAEISIIFKHSKEDKANVLIFRIQPNEGIVLEMWMKKPGLEMKSEKGTMQFCYHQLGKLSEAYERLLLDAINGEQTFFNDAVEVEAQWKFIDNLRSIQNKVLFYKSGTWGPKEADNLIKKDGREWLEPSEELCRI